PHARRPHTWIGEHRRRERTAFAHLVEDRGHVALLLAPDAGDVAPRLAMAGPLHPPAQEVVPLGREVRCLVSPVLEQLTASARPGDQVARVRAEAGGPD